MALPVLGLIVASALWLAAPAGAQTESKCLSSQIKATTAYADAKGKCEAKAAAKGEAVDPVCLAKAEEKAVKALAKAEAKDDCIVTGQGEIADEVVEEFVATVVDIMNPPPVICCEAASVCLYTADAASCTGAPLTGTPGAEGSVCTGDGTCAPPPAVAGSCCADFSSLGIPVDCASGTFDASDCASAGGDFSVAICTPSGFCQ
jgi:hypothetical protein